MKKSERKKQRCVRRRRIETRRNERENERASEREIEREKQREGDEGRLPFTWKRVSGKLSAGNLEASGIHQVYRAFLGHQTDAASSPQRIRSACFPFLLLFFFFSFYFLPSISASAYHDITKIREPSRNSAPLNLPCISRVLPI